MLKNISRILPFFIVTLLCIGAVELFYSMAERYLLVVDQEKAGPAIVAEEGSRTDSTIERHQDYSVIVERNLFQSYMVEEQPETVAETNPLEGLETSTLDLVLMGTITGPEGRSRAVILDKKKNKQDIYYQGDVIEGAEVKEILRGKIILNYQNKDQVLDMTEAATMRPVVEEAAVSPSAPSRRVVVPPTTEQQRRRIVPSDMQPGDVIPEDQSGYDDAGQENFEEQIIEEPELPDENFEPEPIEPELEVLEDAPGPEMEQPSF